MSYVDINIKRKCIYFVVWLKSRALFMTIQDKTGPLSKSGGFVKSSNHNEKSNLSLSVRLTLSLIFCKEKVS